MIRSGETYAGVACLQTAEDESRILHRAVSVSTEAFHSVVSFGCIHCTVNACKRVAFGFELVLNACE